MQPHTIFRFESGDVRFELEGTEEFVRRNLPVFLPFVARSVGSMTAAATSASASAAAPPSGAATTPSAAAAAAAAPTGAAPTAGQADPKDLPAWWEKSVPRGTRVSLQDSILVFAYWMRGFRKFIFTSDDIRQAFEAVGQSEPKSLLQILGTLKRDHNLILGTERRGEYMLNTTGIERVRTILGIPAPGRDSRTSSAPAAGGDAAPREITDAERAARAVLDI